MLEFFSSIGETLLLLVNVIISIFKGFVTVIDLMPKMLAMLTLYTAALPSYIVPFIIAGFALSIAYLIVGRN